MDRKKIAGAIAGAIGLFSALISIGYFLRDTIIEFLISAINIVTILIIIIIILIVIIITYFIYCEIKNRSNNMVKICEYFEEYKEKEYQHYIRDLNGEEHLRSKAMSKSLEILKRKGKTSTLESNVYYLYLFSLLYCVKKRIWATSIMGDEEWVDTNEEKEFQRLNLRAPKKKILVERIFLLKKEDLKKLSTQNVLEQIRNRGDYLKTYIAFIDDISIEKPHLLRDVGNGFLAFDDFAVAQDVFEDDEIRGILHLEESTIRRYNKIFTNLRDFAKPLDMKFIETHKDVIFQKNR